MRMDRSFGPVTEEEQALQRRLLDLCVLSERRGCVLFTPFLTPSEQAFAGLVLEREKVAYQFFGGYEGAERCIVAVGEGRQPPPVAALRLHHAAPLTHRDVLGAAMAQGIRRDAVGDILVGEKETVMLVLREVVPYFLGQFDRAGRIPLQVCEIALSSITPPEQRYETIRDTVASLRLDALCACGFRLSREAAQEGVRRGLVQVNWRPALSASKLLEAGDVISLKGKGKVKLDEIGAYSKKGRIWVQMRRYL